MSYQSKASAMNRTNKQTKIVTLNQQATAISKQTSSKTNTTNKNTNAVTEGSIIC